MQTFMGPCYGLLCPTGPHMELGPQVCKWAKRMHKYNNGSIFGLEKSFSESAMGFQPPPEARSTPKFPI